MMPNTLNRSLLILAVATAVQILPGSASSEQHLNCDAYATAAVAHQNKNISLSCKIQGGGWHSNFEQHRQWCLGAGTMMANLTEQDEGRTRAIDQCQLRTVACNKYTTLAILQNQFNEKFECGLTGGRWSDDADGHRNWCLSTDPNTSIAETERRIAAIDVCHQRPRDMASEAFQNFDQKSNEMFNLLSSVMKAMNEMRMGAVRNML